MTETFNEWMVIQGPTISLLTGPKFDHTLKNDQGMYLIAEGHGNEKLSTFRLTSPTVDLTTATDFCLSFWYLMFGKHTFSLMVELMVPRFRTTSQRLFSVSGPLSKSREDWLYAQV